MPVLKKIKKICSFVVTCCFILCSLTKLAYGWNFVSLPVIPTGSVASGDTYTIPIGEALASLQFGIDYDQLTRHIPGEGHKSWCNDSRYNQFENMEYLRGYQLYALRDCTLTITGTLPQTQASLPLESGHNLIGVGAVSDGDTPAKLFKNISYTALKTLDSSGNLISVSNTTPLVAGKAYYITLTSNSTYYSSTLFGDTTFVYDGDGGRIKRVTPNDETIFIGSLFEINVEGGVETKTKHIFLGDTRICSVNVGARFIEPEYSYYHGDHLGSTSDITDASGVLKQHTEYLPYGETYTMSVGSASASESSEYLFTGKLLDSSTGLYYYDARYYDPEIGRFTQADTIIPDPSDPQAFNRYSYARNNPIRYTDPTGNSWWSKFWDKVGDFFKEKILPAVTSFIIAASVTIATMGMGSPWVIAGISAAATTTLLDTGEGRQLIRRVGNEFFDDILGMRPSTAQKWSSATLHIAGTILINAGLNTIIHPANGPPSANKNIEKNIKDTASSGKIQSATDLGQSSSGIEGRSFAAGEMTENIILCGEVNNAGDAIGQGLKTLEDLQAIKGELNYQTQVMKIVRDLSVRVIPEGEIVPIDIYANGYTGDVIFWEWADVGNTNLYSESTIFTERIWIKGHAERGDLYWKNAI
jgi:RHS repeat-associated protein